MSWTHLSDDERKASKPRSCVICGTLIDKGQRYVARAGVRDGVIGTFGLHLECDKFSRDWTEDEWESYSPGSISRKEVLAECPEVQP